MILCKDATNRVKVKACGIMKTWQPKDINCGPINSTVCKPSSLVADLIYRLKFKFDLSNYLYQEPEST